MKKLLSLVVVIIVLLSFVSCDSFLNNNYNESASQSNQHNQEPSNKDIWSSCPISITGGISGSSNSEVIKVNVNNTSSKDIDSVKLMFTLTHTNYDNSQEEITGFFTLDTIWKGGSISEIISGGNYNFLRTSIYPVCIYFKDGTVWGSSSASREEIIKNSCVFELTHFALNSGNNQTNIIEQNSIDDLRYIVEGVCNNYNSGSTPYNGKLYATVNSATSISILHDIPNALALSEKAKIEEMEKTIVRLFSETLNTEFPENITIYVETSVQYTNATTPQFDGNSNNIDVLKSVIDELCVEYNSDFAYYNGYISVVINSPTSITVEHIIGDKIAKDDEGVVDFLEEGLIALFEDEFETAGFPQKITITVESEYTLAETSQWVTEYELKEISGEPELNFGFFPYFIYNDDGNETVWIARFSLTSQLSGTVKKELLYIYDMPKDFSGIEKYNGINFKYENGELLFNLQDLISVGLLNDDGSFNYNFSEQEFDLEKVKN